MTLLLNQNHPTAQDLEVIIILTHIINTTTIAQKIINTETTITMLLRQQYIENPFITIQTLPLELLAI